MDAITIVSLFEQRASERPDLIAVSEGTSNISYGQLNESANRIAHFLISKGLGCNNVVPFILENSTSAIISILGILKAGCAFLPIDADSPYERLKMLLNNAKATIVLSEKKLIKELNRLQWDCDNILSVLCLDSNNFFEEEETVSEKMREDLWDYVGETASDEISGGGWRSAYDGKPFTKQEMDEYADNVLTKLYPYLKPESNVLEIGCSSGITMFKLAPLVSRYVGLDLSAKILSKTSEQAVLAGHDNVQLHHLWAHQVDQLEEGDFDVIILNSVIQNFSGLNYLRQVLKKSSMLLRDRGLIFCGDLLDLDLKKDLEDSFLQYQKSGQVGAHITKLDWSEDLFIKKEFLIDLCVDIPAIDQVRFSEKIGKTINELTRFRFDALLSLNKPAGAPGSRQKAKNQYDQRDLLECSKTNPDLAINTENLAYIIYTSGSTGQPKGVKISHRSIFNYCHWFISEFKISSVDSSMLLSKLTFDGVYTSVWGALLAGGRLRIVEPAQLLDNEAIINYILNDRITFLKITPTLFNMLLDLRQSNLFKDASFFRLLVIGGESIRTKDIETIFKIRKDLEVVNHYGPTESTVGVIYHRITPEGLSDFVQRPVVGKPILNTRVYILDATMKPVPEYVTGEIFISGEGVAVGYLNDEELTNRKFFPNPFGDFGKMYKSGDLGRWLPGGVIELLGRTDDQVKIRGNRIELGEIEKTITDFSGIQNSKVVAKTDNQDKKYLIAYYVCNQNFNNDSLKAYLRKTLPGFMLPAYYVPVDAFPMKASGKVDVRLLPNPSELEIRDDLVLPATTVEKELVHIWQKLLNRELISVIDHFFEIGGHSLKATKLVSEIYRCFKVDVKLRDVFDAPTIRDLALIIEKSQERAPRRISVAPKLNYYKSTPSQEAIWVESKLNDRNAYVEIGIKIITGNLNLSAFRHAVNAILRRHESLRTRFLTVDGNLMQQVREFEEIDIPIFELCIPASSNLEKELERLSLVYTKQGMDLECDFLFKTALYNIGNDRYAFFLVIHHLVSDGQSLDILTRELASFYNSYLCQSPPDLPILDIQFKDYAFWMEDYLHRPESEATLAYWRQQLSGTLPVLGLVPPNLRSNNDNRSGRRISIPIQKHLYEGLKATCRTTDASTFMVMLSGLYAILYRYTGQEDLIIGIPVAGRKHSALMNQIGLYVNTLPLRILVQGSNSFMSIVEDVKARLLDLYTHQDYPFYKIVNVLNIERALGQSPVYDISASFTDYSSRIEDQNRFEELTITDVDLSVMVSKFDLSFDFRLQNEQLSLVLDYDEQLFSPAWVDGFLNHFLELLTLMIADPAAEVGLCSYLNEEEKQSLIDRASNPEPLSNEATLVDLLNQSATQAPESVAMLVGNESFTYRQLSAKSDKVAQYLIEVCRIQPGDKIGLLFERSSALLFSMIGILKAGATYVPFSYENPPGRNEYIFNDSGCALLVTDIYKQAPFCSEAQIISYSDISSYNPLQLLVDVHRSSELAYIMYTSGTTGVPKGVKISNRSLANLLLSLQRITNYSANDRFLALSSVTFDIAQLELYLPLISCGTVIIGLRDDILNMNSLKTLISEYKPTFMQATPSFWQLLMNSHWAGEKAITLMSGGEQLHRDLAHRLLKVSGRLFNLYGPTETTIWSTYKLVSETYQTGNVGKPVHNTSVYVLDQSLQPVPTGAIGAVFVGGAGVSNGYVNLSELTASKFVESAFYGEVVYDTGDVGYWDENGDLQIMGRKDQQIKLRGNRIELSEIESQILQVGVDFAKCLLLKANGNDVIVAFYLSAEKSSPSVLKKSLQKCLPAIMIPSYFVHLDEIPLNLNKKLDLSRLVSLWEFKANQADEVPNESEAAFLQLVKKVLGAEEISLKQDFFELGGNSILAIQLVSLLESEFQVKIPVRSVFESSKLRELAAIVTSAEKDFFEKNEVLVELAGTYPLTHVQKQIWLASQSEEVSKAYNICCRIDISGALDVPVLIQSFNDLINRYEILRTRFYWNHDADDVVQEVMHYESINLPVEHIKLEDTNSLDIIVQHHINLERGRDFSFEHDQYLFRIKLLQFTSENHVVIFTIHHIVSDAISLGVIYHELVDHYEAALKNSVLNSQIYQFKNFAAWERSQAYSMKAKRFWNNQFEDVLPRLNLTPDFPLSAQLTNNGNTIFYDFSKTHYEWINKIASEANATPFMVYLALINLLLYKISGQTDIIVGVPVSLRKHLWLKNQLGPLINALPVRTMLDHKQSFKFLLIQIRNSLLNLFQHQDYPSHLILEELNSKHGSKQSSLFDVMVSSQQNAFDGNFKRKVHGTVFESLPLVSNKSQFMLSFDFYEGYDKLSLGLNYNTGFFKDISIELVKGKLTKLINEIVFQPNIALSDLNADVDFLNKVNNVAFDF